MASSGNGPFNCVILFNYTNKTPKERICEINFQLAPLLRIYHLQSRIANRYGPALAGDLFENSGTGMDKAGRCIGSLSFREGQDILLTHWFLSVPSAVALHG
jgi:hypothetical protein